MKYSKIGEFIDGKKITHASVYKTIGVDRKTLKNWLSENSTMSVDGLEKISKFLGVHPTYWWHEEDTNIVEDPLPAYSKVEVELLRAQVKSQEKLIARLEKEIDRYEKNSASDKDDLIMATHNGNFKTPRMQH